MEKPFRAREVQEADKGPKSPTQVQQRGSKLMWSPKNRRVSFIMCTSRPCLPSAVKPGLPVSFPCSKSVYKPALPPVALHPFLLHHEMPAYSLWNNKPSCAQSVGEINQARPVLSSATPIMNKGGYQCRAACPIPYF